MYLLFTVCFVIFTSVKCSSIITRNMIRMSDNPALLNNITHNRSANMDQLSAENLAYQRIFPLKNQDRNNISAQSRSLSSPRISSIIQSNFSHSDFPTTVTVSHSEPSFTDSNKNGNEKEFALKQTRYSGSLDSNLGNIKEDNILLPKSNISSEELSKSYWEKYKNFSHDFFDSSDILQSPQKHLVDDEGLQHTSVWKVVKRMYNCLWSSSILSCLQARIKDQIGSDTLFFFQSLKTQLPLFQQEEDPFDREIDDDGEDSDIEGRRKISKKLQLVVPLLLMLKMTMLPALAMMTLVSGKALLLSLVSLGVALVAASIPPAALGASKRQEIAPQSPLPSDQLPNKYYYVM